MKSSRIAVSLFLLVFCMTATVMATNPNIQTMAGILVHLNHFPSDAEKTELAGIAGDAQASVGEKALAMAMMSLKHKVGAADAAALHELLGNASASQDERTLANILLGLAHHPSENDKKKLQAMLE